jgi:hypothetical protein
MGSDADLYGIRKPKNALKEISSSTSLAFSSTLSSLLSTQANNTQQRGRPRASKTKPDIFASHNKNTKKRAARDLEDDDSPGEQVHKKDIGGVDDAVLHRSKRKLEEKAKQYRAMKRDGYIAGEGGQDELLIDFDQKWAESQRQGKETDDSSEAESDDGQGETVEYEDEYGRHRRGTKAEALRMERRKLNKARGAEELDRMSARPSMPSKLIYGDTVQVEAFDPDEPIAAQMEELAKKRDRSMTPPEQKHYEADKEFRIKGVGFYSFSKDADLREKEMAALEQERQETERVRKEMEQRKEKRRQEVEERRKAIGEKRAKKQAESFLDGLTADLGSADG